MSSIADFCTCDKFYCAMNISNCGWHVCDSVQAYSAEDGRCITSLPSIVPAYSSSTGEGNLRHDISAFFAHCRKSL